MIFLPHTAGSELQKLLQQTDDEVTKALGMPRTRYIEKGGSTLKDLLVRKDPWYRLGGGCGRTSCHICHHQGGKGTSCRREAVCYRIECLICDKRSGGSNNEEAGGGGGKTWYIGETSRSAYERVKEHM